MPETFCLTPKAVIALRLLEGTHLHNTCSARALALRLWPERLKECGTSLRRGGLYRAAGAYYSKLQKQGLVGHWMDDFNRGYYLTQKGQEAINAIDQGAEVQVGMWPNSRQGKD